MSVLLIVCDNCGTKYRLPASFSSDKAKCKQCQSVIDVASQRADQQTEAGAEPKPASKARPARARPARASKSDSAAERPARGSRQASGHGNRQRAGVDGDKPARSSRRSRQAPTEDAPQRNNMLWIGGGIGALAVIVVVIAMMWPSDDEAATASDQIANPKSANAAATEDPKQLAANANTKPDAGKPADAADLSDTDPKPAKTAGSEPDQPAADAAPTAKPTDDEAKPDKADAAKPDKADAAAGLLDQPDDVLAERWMQNQTTSMAEVFDAKSLGDVTWPASATEQVQTEISDLLDSISEGGLAGIRAKPKLEKIGYHSIFGIIDRLRGIDYSLSEENMTAWELNKVLERILAGLNTGFAAVSVGEDLDPRKADWNAKTTRAWHRWIENPQFNDEASFNAWKKKRLTRK